jgi:hypothetical protein
LIRLVLLAASLALAVIWIEPTYSPRERTLVLRLRSSQELLDVVRERSRTLGARVVERVRGESDEQKEPPPVGANRSPDDLTTEDREDLDRLVEEVTEDP